MATVTKHRAHVAVGTTITIELTEHEARALDALFGYNLDEFLKVFYEKMGRAYLQPFENGVRSLHETIRGVLSEPLAEVANLRKNISDALKGPRP